MNAKKTVLEIVSALFVCAAQAAGEWSWNPKNGSTDISLDSNWDGEAVPGAGDRAKLDNDHMGGADYTVTVPAASADAPFVLKAGLFFNALANGQTVTLDATGTHLLGESDSGTAWFGSNPFRVNVNDHIFNIEDVNASSTGDFFGYTLDDGKVVFTRDDTKGSTLSFYGTYNNSTLPDGSASPHKTVLFNDGNAGSANSKIVLKAGSALTLNRVQYRGKTPGNEFLVEGGVHHIKSGFSLNEDTNNYGADSHFHVTDGSVTVDSGSIWIGKSAWGRGILHVDGTGLFSVPTGLPVYFPDGSAYTGKVWVAGNGQLVSKSNFMAGHNGGTAEVLVEENGRFDASSFNFGENANGTVTLTAKDDAEVSVASADLARNKGARVTIDAQDRAVVKLKISGDTANQEGAGLTLKTSGDARLSLSDGSNNLGLGNNSDSTVKIDLAGAAFEPYAGGHFNYINFQGGAESEFKLSGVTLWTTNMTVQGLQKDTADHVRTSYTNAVVQTAGTVNIRMDGAGDGLDIRGNDRNAMYHLAGGTLNVGTRGGGMLRIGHGGSGNGYHSVLRQTGGEMNVGATINICDSAADGEVELLGGTARIYTMRGWNWSDVRGNSSKATLYGNGGTIVPFNDGLKFLYTMSEVTVGEKGLTVDSKDYANVTMQALVRNADGAEGLFVKKGSGTLMVSLKETDSGAKGDFANRSLNGSQTFTRVDAGTLLLLDQADAAFGANIIVKGGATLSLAGTVATLTAGSLTLGDGHGFAVLKLDAGDTLTLTNANPIVASCGAIDAPWKSTNGTYPVFTCTDAVDANQLYKIAIYDGDATNDYLWVTETAEGVTTCSVKVVARGEGSSTVTYDSGEVTRAGEGGVSSVTATGETTEEGDITLSQSATVDVAADGSLSVSGSVAGTGTVLEKTGSGRLSLSGDNGELFGSWWSNGGLLEILTRGALGPDELYFPLILGSGTFKYASGLPEAVFEGGLKISAAAKKQATILDNASDITVKGASHVQGLFLKKGVGTLKFDLPEGTFQIGSSAADENIGENSGAVQFPASGDSPTANSGLYGVTVLEGTMKVVGQGVDKTTLATMNTALLGGEYDAKAAPVLDVENATVNWGAGSRHGTVCHDMPSGALSPVVRLNNAKFWSDSPQFGRYSRSNDLVAYLVMTNSEYFGHYMAYIGSTMVRADIDANNSKMRCDGMFGWEINGNVVTGDFYGEDAELTSYNHSDVSSQKGGRIQVGDNVTGNLTFRDGATLKTTRGLIVKNATLGFTFDGGVFQIAAHDSDKDTSSTWAAVENTGFTTVGAGLTLDICEGSTHAFDFPIKGTGGVVKTGAGTFKLVSPRTAGERLLENTGVTEVAEGTLVLDGAVVSEAAQLQVDAGATLDLNGSATLTVASLAAVEGSLVTNVSAITTTSLKLTAGSVPTFVGTTLSVDQAPKTQSVEIDFGTDAPDFSRQPFAVAKFANDDGTPLASLSVSTWRGMARGYTRDTLKPEGARAGGYYVFSYDAATGSLYATYKASSGFVILVR